MTAPEVMRLDELLVHQGLAETRSQAKLLITEGKVLDGSNAPLTKPGRRLATTVSLTVTQPQRFVSRAGEKLDAFLEAFPLPVEGLNALDVGASTGGFTDCLLQRNIASVTCVDVGHDQLHTKIKSNSKVTNIEGYNARNLEAETLPHSKYPLIVMDLSFISLKLVLPRIWPLLASEGHLITLIKPQFEATREEAAIRKGIIKDPQIHRRILDEVKLFSEGNFPKGKIIGEIDSPIKGGDGNKEFLIGWQHAVS